MDPETRPAKPSPSFDPAGTPIPRRRMLLLMGAGVLASGAGMGVLLEACAPVAPVTVALTLDPSSLPMGIPVEVPFTMTNAGGSSVAGSTWMLKTADGSLTAYDPRCTHALCRYKWTAAESRFKCNCHGGQFALDGTVLAGPPPKPLNKFPVTQTGSAVTVSVPGDFATPKESLGA